MIDLKLFCSTESWRPYLQAPFSKGDHTFATNGNVVVRVPRVPDVPDDVKNAPNAGSLFDQNKVDALRFCPAPHGTLPPRTRIECRECDGRGYEHECPDCTCKCEECGGEGSTDGDYERSIGIYGIPLSVRTVRRVWTLPGLELADPPPQKAGDAWPFRFEGGDGILMTRRAVADEHDVWAPAMRDLPLKSHEDK